MEQKRRRRNKRTIDPNIAVYLDEFDISEEEYYEELEKEEKRLEKGNKRRRKQINQHEPEPIRRQQKQQYISEDDEDVEYVYKKNKRPKKNKKIKNNKGKKKKRKKPLRKLLFYLLVFLLIIQAPMLYGIFSSFRFERFSTGSDVKNTKGILLLGVDNDGGDINTGHTDSITYLAANFKTNQAIALPIYRDANITQTCTGTTDNINRIYPNQGIDCLVESTSAFLGLPIDYYAIVTINGLIDIINALGSVEITPTGTFCSDYGEDGVNYCFTEGVRQEMTGPQALAYIRYRGGHSGESRANRQMELILAIKNECMDELLACYVKATPKLPSGARTNIPVTEALAVSKIFSSKFQLETLDVLQGNNTTNEAGWTQYVSEADLKNKTSLIRERIFKL